MFLVVRGVGMLLPEGKIWGVTLMVIVGVIVYGGEMIITHDPMLKIGLDLINNRKKV